MEAHINPTLAGTLSLLLALPYLSPAHHSDASGSFIETSRVSKASDRFIEEYYEDAGLVEDLFTDDAELAAEANFATLQTFAEGLLENTYDLPQEYATVLRDNLAALL
jgi:hypothetical protein